MRGRPRDLASPSFRACLNQRLHHQHHALAWDPRKPKHHPKLREGCNPSMAYFVTALDSCNGQPIRSASSSDVRAPTTASPFSVCKRVVLHLGPSFGIFGRELTLLKMRSCAATLLLCACAASQGCRPFVVASVALSCGGVFQHACSHAPMRCVEPRLLTMASGSCGCSIAWGRSAPLLVH